MIDRRTLTSPTNGRKSSGPRTRAGKARSARNATRHGAYAKSPVLPQIGESEDEWSAFRDAVVADLAPVGPIEASLADRTALLMWRLRRVANAEQMQHSLHLDDIGWQATDAGQREFSHLPLRDGAVEKRDQADESEYVEEAVERAKRVAALGPGETVDPDDGFELLDEIDALADAMGIDTEARPAPDPRRPDGWTAGQLESALVEWLGHPLDGDGDPDSGLRWLDAAVSFLLRQSIRRSGEDFRYRIRTVRLSAERHLLDAKRFERIAQQDTYLSRALYRTLAELHRLQDRREVANARRSKADQTAVN